MKTTADGILIQVRSPGPSFSSGLFESDDFRAEHVVEFHSTSSLEVQLRPETPAKLDLASIKTCFEKRLNPRTGISNLIVRKAAPRRPRHRLALCPPLTLFVFQRQRVHKNRAHDHRKAEKVSSEQV
jgi:hypothetical protein